MTLSTSLLAFLDAVILIQFFVYLRRMPSEVSIHYDFKLKPDYWIPKPLWALLWLAIVVAISVWSYQSKDVNSRLAAAALLAVFTIFNQLLIRANIRSSRLSLAFWVILPLALGFLFLVSKLTGR
jgi:hypothetical protein